MPVDFSLSALMGYGGAAAALITETLRGHVPSAVLICGPEGVGKKTLAEKLICAALHDCRQCAQACDRFEKFKAGGHPDLTVLDDEKTVKIDNARAALDEISRFPTQAKRRVIYIPHADRMTVQTQNCLLKALEDPPADAMFMLVADDMSTLLSTVISRAQVIRMRGMQDAQIMGILKERGVPEDRARGAVRAALGSIGRALELSESDEYFQARAKAIRTLLCARGVADIPDACAAYKDEPDGGMRTLDILSTLIREAMTARVRFCDESALQGYPDFWVQAAKGAPLASFERLLAAVDDARRQRASQVGWQTALEGLLLQMTEEYERWQR